MAVSSRGFDTRHLLLLLAAAVAPSALGWRLAPRSRPAAQRTVALLGGPSRRSGRRRPHLVCSATGLGDKFKLSINLGEGDGTVDQEFRPFFSSSELLTFRYPVPFVLEAEPLDGVIKVTQSGMGLIEGDVLRAFSTLELRFDTAAGMQKFGEGIRGASVDEEERRRSWRRCRPGGWFNLESKPQRCLFVSEGQPFQQARPCPPARAQTRQPHQPRPTAIAAQVIDALVANTPEKTGEIVMVFERPLPSR